MEVATPDDSSTDTVNTYSFSTPTRTDASGSYTFASDLFGRETSATAPLSGSAFTTSYRADSQPLSRSDPNANQTAWTYDAVGRLLTKNTSRSGATDPADLAYTYNRAGLRLSEASAINTTGGTGNGTASFGYDALGRLTSYGSPLGSSSDLAATWQAVPNRDSLAVGGGTPVSTSYDAADRISSTGFAYDADGNLITQPGQNLEWDSLGRLTDVKDSTTHAVISAYTYDALDRLRTVARSGSTIRFHYVGTTTQVSEIVDDSSGTSQLEVGNSWSGERLADWTGSGSNPRYYGTNGHGDTTWVADGSGAVTATERYDPWGNAAASSGTMPEWRFQGSWLDGSTGLYWVVARWYAPELGEFTSEDPMVGTHTRGADGTYAYSAGSPISRADIYGLSSTVALSFAASQPTTNCDARTLKPDRFDVSVSAAFLGSNSCRTTIKSDSSRPPDRSGRGDFYVGVRGDIDWFANIFLPAGVAYVAVHVNATLHDDDANYSMQTYGYDHAEQGCGGAFTKASLCVPLESAGSLSEHEVFYPPFGWTNLMASHHYSIILTFDLTASAALLATASMRVKARDLSASISWIHDSKGGQGGV